MQTKDVKKFLIIFLFQFRRFIGSDNKEKYFTTIQRIRIVNEVLSRAVFGKQRKGEVGIDRLVHEGVFSAAYPLHDVCENNCIRH